MKLFYLLIVSYNAIFTKSNMLGPADFIFKSFEHCEEPKHVIDFWITQKRYNRSVSVLNFNWSTPYDIGDDVILELKGWMKKEGGYKPGTFYMKDKTCVVLNKLLGGTFLDMLHAAGVEDCPLPTGYHQASAYYFDNEKFTVPHVYGAYKMDIFLFKNQELQSCFHAYYDMVSKEKSRIPRDKLP